MNMFLHKATIPFFVFITGACVLIIEILAIRILSPYFGNTIYTVSGVITVVLLALSIGYYAGGKLADKYPEEKIFYGIILLSGFAVILLHLLGVILLPIIGYSLPISQGPVISSVILFFLQSLMLGTLSPFAIKLQKVRLENLGVGSASGQIFFWSTLGSIFGSLSAGFFLIPNFGIDKIILGVGFLLIVLGGFGIIRISIFPKLLLAIFALVVMLFLVDSINLDNKNLVFAKDSLYQKILIQDGTYNGKPTRFLQQDRNSSAAEFIGSEELAYEYTKYYTLYQLFNSNIKNSLNIGGGAYSVPKALLKDLPNLQVDVVEIDPILFELGKKYFNVPDNPRLKNFAEDGRRFLHDTNKKYDLIFSDAYSSFYSTPEHLTTQEFFQLAKSRLSDGGVFIANVIGSLPDNSDTSKKAESFALSEMKTFKSVFENSYFFAVQSPKSTKPQNIIFVACNCNDVIDFNGQKIKNNENYIISSLPEKIIGQSKIDLSPYQLLTDNFAPVDYLISKEFNNIY